MVVSESEVPPVHDGGLLIHSAPFALIDSHCGVTVSQLRDCYFRCDGDGELLQRVAAVDGKASEANQSLDTPRSSSSDCLQPKQNHNWLRLQNLLHIAVFQRQPSARLAGCVVQSRRDR
jgi:hypothetical protein